MIAKKRTAFTLLMLMLLLTGCSPDSPPSSNARGEPDRTTDTWSSSFESKGDKLDFLERYLIFFSEVEDAEFHVVYYDNSGGLIPGPSDWDIRVALKVAPEDIPLWTDGMEKSVPDQIGIGLWDGLKTERVTWEERDSPEYWKRPDSNTYLVVYPESGILLKIASTVYKPSPY